MANFNDTYFVIQGVEPEFVTGGTSKTNGLYSSRSRAETHINQMLELYKEYASRSNSTERAKTSYQDKINEIKLWEIKEVKVIAV